MAPGSAGGQAAFRRPVTETDLKMPLEFYASARQTGDFEQGIRSALMVVLASPEFLYRFSSPPADLAPGAAYALAHAFG